MGKNKINVSEIFHSMQGEGNTMGNPSVFLRLQACNLMCGGIGTDKDKQLHNGAEWRCDTIEVWKEGNRWEVKDLAGHLFYEYGSDFLSNSQLVITGGEPMLQQNYFSQLIKVLRKNLEKNIRVEVETNGTIKPTDSCANIVDQFNVSPKLSNSGMPRNRRIKEDSLKYLSGLNTSRFIFKFVVTKESDIQEIVNDYIRPFDIPKDQVWLMPGCSNRDQFERKAPLVAKACDQYGFHFSSRLQINLWNETTGV